MLKILWREVRTGAQRPAGRPRAIFQVSDDGGLDQGGGTEWHIGPDLMVEPTGFTNVDSSCETETNGTYTVFYWKVHWGYMLQTSY